VSAAEIERLLANAAVGTWDTPVHRESRKRRSSQAWTQLRQVVNRLPIAAFACDPQGRLVLAEGLLFEHLGLPADLLDRSLASMLAPAVPNGVSPLNRPLGEALRGRPSVTTVPAADRWLQIHLSPHHEPGQPVTVLGVAMTSPPDPGDGPRTVVTNAGLSCRPVGIIKHISIPILIV
jgi:hypothetical protein